MSDSSFIVPPLSRARLREAARKIRIIYKEVAEYDQPFFPIVEFLDIWLPRIMPEFELQVRERHELGTAHGMTYPDKQVIQIREDVYEGASRGVGRDRFTLAHELGHLVIHPGIGLARSVANEHVAKYRQSEWQADAFAGELLISAQHIHQCSSPNEAALLFGVSEKAARTQWSVFQRDGILK